MEEYLKILQDMDMIWQVAIGLIIFVFIYKLFKKKDDKNIKKKDFKDTRISFGVYKDKKYSEMPTEQLKKHIRNTILTKKELERRKQVDDDNNPALKTEDKENMKKYGDDFEKKVGAYYQQKGYKIDARGLRIGKKDGGIDIIATKDDEILLIQCKYIKRSEYITHSMIKEFYGNCSIYIDKENISRDNIYICYTR
ncbi:MAG: hypothetical protein DRG11_02010 [Epsilonproteobacteria bacterium]|nr:MAG: hypothetical protein DRG11_02010 [Campylobacterota bacterium]